MTMYFPDEGADVPARVCTRSAGTARRQPEWSPANSIDSARGEDAPPQVRLDIVMTKHYRHSLRRHVIKLHPRNDQITSVRSTIQVSFLHCDDDIHKKIDRRACQAKQPRVDAFYGQKW